MSSINPYEAPVNPPKPKLPGVPYRVDPRRLSLGEVLRCTKNPAQGLWKWLSWKLRLGGDPTYILAVPTVPEMTAELADMPPGVAEHFLNFQQQAEALGFYGRCVSMTVNENADPVCLMMRMLSRDPRFYLEVAFLAIDRSYMSRHNLISASHAREYWATSNGFPIDRRPPAVKPRYAKGVSLPDMLQIHLQRIANVHVPLRAVTSFEDVMTVVQELVNEYIQFQLARGYYTRVEAAAGSLESKS